MGYESIAHKAKGRMGYWLIGYEGERNNCFSKIQLVGKKISRLNIFRKLKLDINFFFIIIAKTLQIWRALFATSWL